jgi:hypothetical protein
LIEIATALSDAGAASPFAQNSGEKRLGSAGS